MNHTIKLTLISLVMYLLQQQHLALEGVGNMHGQWI